MPTPMPQVDGWLKLICLHQNSLRAIQTFGIIDAISLYIMGAASISTTCGMRMDISYLDDIRKQIIFIPDQGEEKEAQKFASKMGWRGKVMRCNYPEGVKDVSDIFNSEHRNELQSVLNVRNV